MKQLAILLTFSFCGFDAISQNQLTLDQILNLENYSYRSMQAYFFKTMSLIHEEEKWHYIGYKECEPPVYLEDSCEWQCQSFETQSDWLPASSSAFFDDQNLGYEEEERKTSYFGRDYDFSNETAVTFVTLEYSRRRDNINCKRIVGSPRESIHLEIQFNSRSEWQSFKSDVLRELDFLETFSWREGTPPEMRFGLRRYRTSWGAWRGVYITLRESEDGSYVFAKVFFDHFID